MRAEQVRGDLVTAAAIWKQLDDLVVCERNNENGNRNRGREIKAKMRMPAERKVRFRE